MEFTKFEVEESEIQASAQPYGKTDANGKTLLSPLQGEALYHEIDQSLS